MDFFQTYIIELKEREGSPFYAVEHFIEGGYIKYNSNSGFVSDINRLTPQTFSHFTFEKSNHQLIVVDIQGERPHTIHTYTVTIAIVRQCRKNDLLSLSLSLCLNHSVSLPPHTPTHSLSTSNTHSFSPSFHSLPPSLSLTHTHTHSPPPPPSPFVPQV